MNSFANSGARREAGSWRRSRGLVFTYRSDDSHVPHYKDRMMFRRARRGPDQSHRRSGITRANSIDPEESGSSASLNKAHVIRKEMAPSQVTGPGAISDFTPGIGEAGHVIPRGHLGSGQARKRTWAEMVPVGRERAQKNGPERRRRSQASVYLAGSAGQWLRVGARSIIRRRGSSANPKTATDPESSLCVRSMPHGVGVLLEPHGTLEQSSLVAHPFAKLLGDMARQPLGALSVAGNAAPDTHPVECSLKHIQFVGAHLDGRLFCDLLHRYFRIAVDERFSVHWRYRSLVKTVSGRCSLGCLSGSN